MEAKQRKGLHSVLWKITAAMVLCILLLLLFNWLLNNFVLQSFYTQQKKQGLEEAYVQADRLIQDDDEAFRRAMDDLAQTSNMFTLIWNTRRMIYDFQNRTAGFIQVPYFDMSPGTYQVVEEEKASPFPRITSSPAPSSCTAACIPGSISSSRPPWPRSRRASPSPTGSCCFPGRSPC